MLARLIFFATLALTAPAVAQEAPATPAQIAAARAEAEAIIGAAGAADLFANVTDAAAPRVRHNLSGMVCTFTAGERRNNIRIYPNSPRGEDVSCGTNALGAAFTTYATRYNPMPSEEEDLRETVSSIRRAWPGAEPFTGEVTIASSDNLPAPKLAVLKIEHNGQQLVTLALVSHLEGWAFKTRASGPVEDAGTVSLFAGISFISALSPIVED